MKARWVALEAWLAARAERERVVLLFAFVCIVGVLTYVGWVEPVLQARSAALARILEQQRLLATVQEQRAQTQRVLGSDPNAAVRERVDSVRRELDDIDRKLAQLQGTLLAPARMSRVLQELLGTDRRVRLVSMRNLPAAAVDAAHVTQADARGDAMRGAQVFRHGIEVVLQGRQRDLLAYVDRLERQPWQLFWAQVTLTADHSRATLRLTLYTLSLEEAWLVV